MASSTAQTKVDAVVQKATPPQLSGAQLYSRFAIAGAICCSVTHGALTPVDVYVLVLQAVFSHHAATPASTPGRRFSQAIDR